MFDVHEVNIAIELWGVAFCAVGIASAFLLAGADRHHRNQVAGLFAGELVMAGGDAVAGIFRGQEGALAWTGTHVGNFAVFAGGFALVALLTLYLRGRIEEAGGPDLRRWAIGVGIAAGVMCALALAGTFYYIDDSNLYHRAGLYWVSQAFPLVVSLVNAALLWRSRRELAGLAAVCLVFFAALPTLAALAQILVYGLNFNVVVAVAGLLVVFLEMQQHAARAMARSASELASARVWLAESRMQVMASQMQPHFLFNALDTVYVLVDEDPVRAKEALAAFSRYLRANLDSLKHTAPVDITREMEHVRTYLELERMTDEDKLSYEIDMQATGFTVPALSVQTLAENAVRHGIAQRKEGGRVAVRTDETEAEYLVSVADDGVGFDVAALEDAPGIGVSNTRNRLEALCGGALEVQSEPGAGTTVTMHIPKTRGGAEA